MEPSGHTAFVCFECHFLEQPLHYVIWFHACVCVSHFRHHHRRHCRRIHFDYGIQPALFVDLCCNCCFAHIIFLMCAHKYQCNENGSWHFANASYNFHLFSETNTKKIRCCCCCCCYAFLWHNINILKVHYCWLCFADCRHHIHFANTFSV